MKCGGVVLRVFVCVGLVVSCVVWVCSCCGFVGVTCFSSHLEATKRKYFARTSALADEDFDESSSSFPPPSVFRIPYYYCLSYILSTQIRITLKRRNASISRERVLWPMQISTNPPADGAGGGGAAGRK